MGQSLHMSQYDFWIISEHLPLLVLLYVTTFFPTIPAVDMAN